MKYPTFWFAFIAAGIFSYDGSLAMLLPIVPLFLIKLQMEKTFLGIPLLLLGIGQITGTVIFAYALARSQERKFYLIFTFLIFAICGVNYMVLTEIIQFLVSAFLQGLGSGFIWQIALVVTSELFHEDEQARINGYIFATFNFASIICPIYSTIIYDSFGSFGFGLSIAAVGIFLFFASFCCPQEKKYHTVKSQESLSPKQIMSPIFISGIFLSFVSAGLRAGLETYIPIILQDRFDVPDRYIGLFWLFITVPATLSCVVLGRMASYFTEFLLLWIGVGFLTASIFLILYGQHIAIFCTGLVCLALGFTYTSAPVPSFLVKTLQVHPSALHGFRNVFTAMGIGLYPLLVGLLLQFVSLNGLALLFFMSLIICVPFMMASRRLVKLKTRDITIL